MSKEIRKSVKPTGTRLGIIYGNYKVHKQQIDGCPLFRPILFALLGIWKRMGVSRTYMLG